jgi:hypothetical protein
VKYRRTLREKQEMVRQKVRFGNATDAIKIWFILSDQETIDLLYDATLQNWAQTRQIGAHFVRSINAPVG